MKKKHILLLGASGMLGSMLLDVFAQEDTLDVTVTVRDEKKRDFLRKKYSSVTLEHFAVDDSEDVLGSVQDFAWVINAIGITKPFIHDDNAYEIERAVRINSLFPHRLSKAVENTSTRVLQIATDCVYDGEKGKYKEEDAHNAIDVYGKTKSLGEVYSTQVHHLRTSIIGPEQGNEKFLLEWFLHSKKNASLTGFTNHLWNGTTTLHFAKICLGIILHDTPLPHIQHVVPADVVTKAELLHIFVNAFDRNDIEITSTTAKNFDREDITIYKVNAKEGVNRTLGTLHDKINKQLWKNAGYKNPPTIEEMVLELADYMEQRQILDRAK